MEPDLRAIGILNFMAADLFADAGFDDQFFAQFTREGFREPFARLDFSAGKFPLEGVTPAAFALADQHISVPLDHRGDDFHSGIIGTRMATRAPEASSKTQTEVCATCHA